jgi:hypothetical protein
MRVKTPNIIKEVLGEEIYNQLEEHFKDHVPNLTFKIFTNKEGYENFKEALKNEQNGKKERRINRSKK